MWHLAIETEAPILLDSIANFLNAENGAERDGLHQLRDKAHAKVDPASLLPRKEFEPSPHHSS
jgi:hypothetical protein